LKGLRNSRIRQVTEPEDSSLLEEGTSRRYKQRPAVSDEKGEVVTLFPALRQGTYSPTDRSGGPQEAAARERDAAMDERDREWVNSRLETVEERMNGRLVGLDAKMQTMSDTSPTKW
jgi:hypothetical protein